VFLPVAGRNQGERARKRSARLSPRDQNRMRREGRREEFKFNSVSSSRFPSVISRDFLFSGKEFNTETRRHGEEKTKQG